MFLDPSDISTFYQQGGDWEEFLLKFSAPLSFGVLTKNSDTWPDIVAGDKQLGLHFFQLSASLWLWEHLFLILLNIKANFLEEFESPSSKGGNKCHML